MLTLSLGLTIAVSALRVVLLARLFWTGLHRQYPLFIAYNLFSLFTSGIGAIVSGNARLYYFNYWIGEALLNVLALLVLLAVIKPAAEVTYIERPSLRFLPPILMIAAIAIPIWQGVYHPLSPRLVGHVASGLYSFVLAILCLEALILAWCLALSKSIPWGNYDFAIVSGFGMSAVVKWVAYLARWNYGSRYETLFHYLIPAAATGAALVWVVAFFRSEPPTTKQEPDAGEIKRLTDLLQEHTEFVIQILKDPRWRRRPEPGQSRRPLP